MSAASPLHVEGGIQFIPHILHLRDIPSGLRASMTEMWDAILRLRWDYELTGETLMPDTWTDLFFAQYTGRSERFVQKGLNALEGKNKDFKFPGIIARHTAHGRRNIEITGRIAGRKDKDRAPTSGRPKGPRPKGEPIPNVGTVPETTPAQLEANAANLAAAAPAPDPGDELPARVTAQLLRNIIAGVATRPAPKTREQIEAERIRQREALAARAARAGQAEAPGPDDGLESDRE